MRLIPVLRTLILSFLPLDRTFASKMCVAAIGRLQDDRLEGCELTVRQTFVELVTHTGILLDLKRFGAHFGSRPTTRAIKQRMRLIEELYLCIELEDEAVRIQFAPDLPVFVHSRVIRDRNPEILSIPDLYQLYMRFGLRFARRSSLN